MYKIRYYNHIAEKGLRCLPTEIQCSDSETAADGLLLRSHKLQVSEIEASVCAVSRAGAGTNNIPLEDCSKRGIVVFNTPGANANSVKELVLCALFLSSRQLSQSIAWLKQQKVIEAAEVEAAKKNFAGPEIAGKTLGIVGLGAIGSLVANAAEALGMNVVGYDPFLSVKNALKLPKGIQLYEDICDLLQVSDYISLHLPLSAETGGLLGLEQLKTAKQGARLINFARAELVDEDAVLQALKTGKLSYYICDFPSEKLKTVKNAICFPHLGASTPEAEENCAVMACEQLADFLLHGNIRNSVNYPSCELERETEHRLTFVHENIPNILSQISAILAEQGLNIQEMTNRHRTSFAYTIVDVDLAPKTETLQKLKAISGILQLRYLIA